MTSFGTIFALTSLILVTPAWAEFGLDNRYNDADGDLVADIPTDPVRQIDPSTLIFSYTGAPSLYAEVWEGFLDHIEQVTGKQVQFFPVQSPAEQIEAMRTGRLHVAGFNTGSIPLAVACAGFRPFAMMAAADGSFGYEMEIITYPGSGIANIADLKGKEIAFTAETSNSGFKAPSVLLNAEFGMTLGKDYTAVFSGEHENSILGVANKDYLAAAIANSVKSRMIQRGMVKDDQFEILYTSQTFPTTGYGVVYNLKPEIQESIREAFFSFAWEGSKLAEEFSKSGGDQYIPITFKDDWMVVRQIDEASGVDYKCN